MWIEVARAGLGLTDSSPKDTAPGSGTSVVPYGVTSAKALSLPFQSSAESL
mgnify:CR=1 FL=1